MLYQDRSISQNLRNALGQVDNVFEGTILSLESQSDLVQLLPVTLQPSGEYVLCEIVYICAGPGRGILFPPKVDDRVVVLQLDGDSGYLVALHGLFSPAAPMPANAGPGITVWSEDGIVVARDLAAARQQPVLAPLPADLKTAWDQVKDTFQTIASLPPTVQTGPAAALALDAVRLQLGLLAGQMAALSTQLAQPEAYLSGSMEIE